jgi:hypothetical protein
VVPQARHRTDTSAWWFRPRVLAAVAVATTGLAVAVWLPSRDDVAEAEVRSRQSASFGRSTFSDDFSSRRGLDRSKWSVGGSVVSARVDDGRLTVSRPLTARPSFTAKFGHAEARIKVSRPSGVWRAFAVLDEDRRLPSSELEPLDGGVDPTSGRNFHTYEIDWTEDTVTWTVDGRPSLRLDRDSPGEALTLVLNLATEGRSSGRMVVDFVRVFTSNDAPPAGSPSPSAPESPSPTSPSEPADPSPTSPSAPAPTSPSEPAPTSPTPSPTPSETPSPTPTSPPAEVAAWAAFVDYQAGDLVSYEGVTYRVLEAHTSLPGWEPTNLPNLFAKV